LLVLGGTAFVGRAVVEAALAAGWYVTTFNRGVSNVDVEGVEAVAGRLRLEASLDCSDGGDGRMPDVGVADVALEKPGGVLGADDR
jgi:nucleoside-diphosphate-sugar epimerase